MAENPAAEPTQVDITTLSEQQIAKLFEQSTLNLVAIPEPQRSAYVKEVIKQIVEAARKISTMPKMEQYTAANMLLGEIIQSTPTIIPAVLYTMKRGPIKTKCPHCSQEIVLEEPDFRTFYNELLNEALNGALERVKT